MAMVKTMKLGFAAGVVVLAGCGTQDASGTGGASSPSVVATEEPSATASATLSASPSASGSTTEAAERTVEVSTPVAFSITVPGDWVEDETISSSTTWAFRSGIDRWVTFTELGPDTVDGWVQELTANPSLTVTEPEVVDIGRATGVSLDLELSEGEVVLFEEAWGEYVVTADRPNRAWVLDVGGEVVLIVTDAPAAAFDNWVATVEDVLGTIAWSE